MPLHRPASLWDRLPTLQSLPLPDHLSERPPERAPARPPGPLPAGGPSARAAAAPLRAGGADVPPPAPDVVPLPLPLPPTPVPPSEPAPPGVTEPPIPGRHVPVRDPLVRWDADMAWARRAHARARRLH